jgi:hypothetical protein
VGPPASSWATVHIKNEGTSDPLAIPDLLQKPSYEQNLLKKTTIYSWIFTNTAYVFLNDIHTQATVRLSKWKPQFMHNHSESIHLNRCMETGTLLIPTSIKANTAKTVAITTHDVVINCAPRTPTFLPKKPATILPNKGKKIILKYIIYIQSLRFLFMFPLFHRNNTSYFRGLPPTLSRLAASKVLRKAGYTHNY